MEDAKNRKPWIDAPFRETKLIKLVSYLRLEFNIDFIHQRGFFCMHKDTFLNLNSHKHTFFICEITTVRKFWDNSMCKSDQGKANLDGIEFWVSKIINKNTSMKEHKTLRLGLGMRVNVTQLFKVHNCRKWIFQRSRHPWKSKILSFRANHGSTSGSC